MNQIIMYHEIHRLKREDHLKVSQIARKLVTDRRTIKKYLKMSEEEYFKFSEEQSDREKLLDKYEDFVKARLEDVTDASSAQIHDWLKEHHKDFINVSEKTVFNFVLFVRNKYGIPKPFNYREYSQVEELPYGKQAQVDFGEYNMTTYDGKRKKVWFLSMVLSRSRHKYVIFNGNHFNTLTTIDAHEKCFQYLEGIPEQLVYDQDKLMLTDENYGDLILTEQFRQYTKQRGFKLHFCRKADPESKGKIENVIKYIKYNFLRGRKYDDINTLNGQVYAWLNRTANAKIHTSIKKVPCEEWKIEKQYLKPVNEVIRILTSLKTYTVRKDNTIVYKSNFYGLPLGTYQGDGIKLSVKITDENNIIIYDPDNNEIVRYNVNPGKGKLITKNNFKRDYSSKIEELIDELSGEFKHSQKAMDYFMEIRRDNPRYIRDQLLLIRKNIETYGMEIIDQVLDYCIQNKILKATDFESVAKKIKSDSVEEKNIIDQQIKVRTINKSTFKIIPQKSNISDYEKLIN